MEKVEVTVRFDLIGSQLVIKCTDPIGELVSARVVPMSSSVSVKYEAYKDALGHKSRIKHPTPDMYEFLELLEELEDTLDNNYWTVLNLTKSSCTFIDRPHLVVK